MSARDYVEKDYYAALGVAKDARGRRTSRRPTASWPRELHPDTQPRRPRSGSRRSPRPTTCSPTTAKRKEYDEARGRCSARAARAPAATPAAGSRLRPRRPVRPGRRSTAAACGDVFGGLFGGAAGQRSGRARAGAPTSRPTVTLSFLDAVRGATVPLRLRRPGACTTCHGTGAAPGTRPQTCPICDGAGSTTRNQGGFAFAEPCRACRGTGRTIETPCPTLPRHGRGRRASRTLNVRIPAGVADGQRIRLAGAAAPGERGGAGRRPARHGARHAARRSSAARATTSR